MDKKELGDSVRRRLGAVRARAEAVERDICKQMYCDAVEEALQRAGESALKHEPHVRALGDERAEYSFLRIRREQLETELAALGPEEIGPVIAVNAPILGAKLPPRPTVTKGPRNG